MTTRPTEAVIKYLASLSGAGVGAASRVSFALYAAAAENSIALNRVAVRLICAPAALTLITLWSVLFALEAGAQPSRVIWEAMSVESRVQALVTAMTLEQKVGQMTQAEIGSASPADVKKYHLGAVLNGGGSRPHGDKYARLSDWVKLADEYYDASTTISSNGTVVSVPVLWGTDAVHGNNGVYGATIFPHNIGLGAARNAKLAGDIAAATAKAVRASGVQWVFAPTLAVARDVRWGRTYESFSEDPAVVAEYAGTVVASMQGKLLGDANVLATAKHFIGDGGTQDGVDLGVATATLAELETIHGAGFKRALRADVQTIMASLHSWIDASTGKLHGRVHGDKTLLTDLLKERWGFDGFVVSDWNGIGHVAGCSNTSCPAAINAGIDMVMVPDQWRDFIANTIVQVKRGEVPMARIDDAVARILRVKLRAGLLQNRPSASRFAGDETALQARNFARHAVRSSLVLLKNNGAVLPLSRGKRVLVVGKGADNLEMQTGGWTLSWQGTGNRNSDFPAGETIFAGLRHALGASNVVMAATAAGIDVKRFDAVVLVIGETPYAEVNGDLPPSDTLRHTSRYPEDLEALRTAAGRGVPIITVMLSGRPVYANEVLNQSDAFVAAWLPGTEGGGVADLLVRKADGSVGFDFVGTLPFAWPVTDCPEKRQSLSRSSNFRFEVGYGLKYTMPSLVGLLPEDKRTGGCAAEHELVVVDQFAQRPYGLQVSVEAEGWRTHYVGDDAHMEMQVPNVNPAIRVESIKMGADRRAVKATWFSPARLTIASRPKATLSNYRDASLVLDFTVHAAPRSTVKLEMKCGDACHAELDVTRAFSTPDRAARTLNIPLSCFAKNGANLNRVEVPFAMVTRDAFAVSIARVRVVAGAARDASASPCEAFSVAAVTRQ